MKEGNWCFGQRKSSSCDFQQWVGLLGRQIEKSLLMKIQWKQQQILHVKIVYKHSMTYRKSVLDREGRGY